MTQVASLDLCKELYELSGWLENNTKRYYLEENAWQILSDYSLGYLLRKLPIGHPENNIFAELSVHRYLKDKWSAIWQTEDMKTEIMQVADTPENAVCKLAIELFKQGVLKR